MQMWTLIAIAAILLPAACKTSPASDAAVRSADAASSAGAPGLSQDALDKKLSHLSESEYVAACKEAGVEFPAKVDCFGENSVELPIFTVGSDGKTSELVTSGNDDQFIEDVHAVDVPLLTQQPYPHSRVRRIDVGATTCVMVCRRKLFDRRDSTFFQDTNLICHNPQNGNTCFANTRLLATEGVDTAKLPALGTLEDPHANKWMIPRQLHEFGSCTSCHANGPFIHTPYIDQAKIAGKKLVPSVPRGPYQVVDAELFYTWPKIQELNAPGTEPCRECHRIGTLSAEGCRIIGNSAGTVQIENSAHQAGSVDKPSWYYMPPKGALNGREAEFRAALRIIGDCCTDPKRPECTYTGG